MIYGWHFLQGDRLRDGRRAPKDGFWLQHKGKIKMCWSGLHASKRPLDALKYAPGNTLCRVALRGDEFELASDKIVARERKIIWRLDAENLLFAFARHLALQYVDFWEAPEVVLRFLRTGEDAADASWYAANAASAAAREQDVLLRTFIREARRGIERWEFQEF